MSTTTAPGTPAIPASAESAESAESAAQAGSAAFVDERPRNVWPIMSGVLLVLLLASLDQTIVGTAMPRVIADLNGFDRYAWVTTVYMLTSTVVVPIYGKLSDLFGRKIILIVGIALFLLGSALSGAAQTMTQLILFRGLQGLGAGALMPVAIAIVGDLFAPRERAKWQGLTGAVFGVASIFGPTLGGWITDSLSWRWVFYVNLPVGVVALAVLVFVMPPLRTGHGVVRIDVVGAVLLVAGVVPLLLALTWAGTTYAWLSPQIIALVAGAVALLAACGFYEARFPEPILEPRLFTNRIFTVSVLTTGLIGAGMFGALLFVPLFIQGVAGASATNSGAVLTPLMLMAIIGSVASGQLMARWGRYRYIAMGGVILMLAGMGLLLRLDVHSSSGMALPALLVLGAGLGFGMSLYTIVVQNAFPRERLGQVTGALTFFRSIGGTLGVAVFGSFLTNRYTATLAHTLPAAAIARLPANRRHAFDNPQLLMQPGVENSMRHAFERLGPHGLQLYTALITGVKQALASSLHDVFLVALAVTALALITVLFLPEIPLRGRDPQANGTPEEAAAR